MPQSSPHLLPAPSPPLLQPRQLKIGEEHGQLNDGWVKPFNVSDYHYPEADEGDSGPKLILLEWHVSNARGFLLPHQPAGWQGTGWAHSTQLGPPDFPTYPRACKNFQPFLQVEYSCQLPDTRCTRISKPTRK